MNKKQETNKRTGLMRLMALALAVCMVVLQCFVVLSVNMDTVYAADGLTITAEYGDGTIASRTLSKSDLEAVEQKEATVQDEGGNDVTISGPSVYEIMKAAGLDTASISTVKFSSGGGLIEVSKNNKDAFLTLDTDPYGLYISGSSITDITAIDGMEIVQKDSVTPIKFSKKPTASKSSPNVGETINITYKLSVDEFYKNSDGYNEADATKLTWSGNSNATVLTTTTSGTSGTVKVKIEKKGQIKVTPSSGSHSSLTSGVSVVVNGKATTTTTKATTTKKSTTKKPNTKRPTTHRSSYHYTGGGGYHPTTRSTITTRRTIPTTATRPGATTSSAATASNADSSTLAPSYRTLRVKEIYLSQVAQEPEEEFTEEWDDEEDWEDWDEEDWDDEDWDEDGVGLPAAAGSAAMAAAACGAGVVGRIRKFHVDMGDAAAAAAAGKAESGKGKGRGFGRKSKAEESAGPDGEAKPRRGIKSKKADTPDKIVRTSQEMAAEESKKSRKKIFRKK